MATAVSGNAERIPYTQYTQPVKQETAQPQNQQSPLPAAPVNNNFVAPSLTVAEGPQEIKGRPQLGEILNDTYNTLSSSPINGEDGSPKKRKSWFGIIKNIAVIGLLFWGGQKLFKKVNPSNAQHSTLEDIMAGINSFFGDIASRNYTKVDDLKLHLDDIVNTSKTRALLPLNLHRATVRVINSEASETREVVDLVKKVATEARNVRGRTPIITVTLAENAQNHLNEVADVIKRGNTADLSDEACKAIEYVRLDYTKTSSKANNYLINVIGSNAETNLGDSVNNRGFRKFWKEFWT